MRSLSPAERRALKAQAPALHPVVIVGQRGLTPAVMNEIDVSLRAHELVKIRIASANRPEREEALTRICATLDAAAVQHLGKLLIVWRPRPPADVAANKTAARRSPATKRRPLPAPPQPAPGGRTPSTTRVRGTDGRPSPRPTAARKKHSAGLQPGPAATSRRRRGACQT